MIDSDTKSSNKPLSPSIMKHFLVVGINISHLKDNKKEPEVISSFTMNQKKSELSTIITLINHDGNTINNIFPSKSDFLNKISLDSTNSCELDCNLYLNEYIAAHCPDPFFHSFIYKYWGDEVYEWYFNCFIFWEELDPKDNKIVPVFAAKALIIITTDAYFSLCKKLLRLIYKISTRRNQQIEIDPIEPFIINIFNKLRTHNNIDLDIKIDELIRYHIRREQFFPVCDMNLYLFFQLFNLADVLFLAEQFLRKRTIIVISSSIHYLYPIFHILMTLIHPLNLTDNTYLYRLLTPKIVNVLINDFPIFLFIYAKKIDDEVITAIANKRQFTTVITIAFKALSQKLTARKRFYQLGSKDKNNNAKLIVSKTFPSTSIIHQVIKDTNTETIFDLIQSSIKNIKPNKKSSLLHSDNYIEIRQFFFGLMMKFFVSIMPTMTFYITKGKELIIDYAQKIAVNDDNFVKELLTCPTFDIVKKHALDINNPNLKDFILLDELIKITMFDSRRLYYDFKTFETTKQSSDEDKGDDHSFFDNNTLVNILQIESKPMYKSNKMAYLSQINKHLLRNTTESSCRLLKKDNQYHIKYDLISFNFELYSSMLAINFNQINAKENILLIEIDTFQKLLQYGCIPSLKLEHYISGATGLCLALLLINNLLTDLFQDNFLQLLKLFQFTSGFEKNFNFLISFLYEIILSNDWSEKEYMIRYLNSLKAFGLLPTVTIVLKFKHKLKSIADNNWSLLDDFKDQIDIKDSNINDNPVKGFQLRIVSQSVVTDEKQCCEDLLSSLNEEFKCKKCKKHLIIRTTLKKGDIIDHQLSSPLKIFNRMINKILQNQSVLIKDVNNFYEEWLNDILNIAFIMKKSYSVLLFH